MTIRQMFQRLSLTLAVAMAATVMTAQAARADFEICNYSRGMADVAVGYYDPDYGDWVSIGWYQVKTGQCDILFALHEFWVDEYIYVYAESSSEQLEWAGEFDFCTADDAFEIYGYESCKKRGYYTMGFAEVDVRGYNTFTYELLD